MANSTEDHWDETSPSLSQPRRAGAAEILSLRKGVRKRTAREHEQFDVAGVGGEHLPGSAKVYVSASVAPTLRPDGVTALNADDAGRLWAFTDSGRLKQWNGSAWIEINYPSSENFNQANASPYNIPFTKAGLAAGTYLVWVYGATNDEATISVTVNSITVQLACGTGAFMIPFLVTVTTQVQVSAASFPAAGGNVQGMCGVRVAW